ncbi:hypothetical protein PVK06_041863 [Gossypium arboreum]|uniref:Uncharacterized protein n=1 Tax=Gossypium arboreum TaxID=29729 RepID=A0ABR0NA03_GOSAR|nr:hypothetical protein PVK06_041863 [Gossypium arboreum]
MVHVLRDCLAMKDECMHVLPNHLKQKFFSDTFQNISWSATVVVKVSISWTRQFESYLSGYKINVSNLSPVNISDNTWVLLSTDGVVARETSYAAIGGVIILDGILILLNKVYRRTIIQTDNLEVAQVLTDLGLEGPGIIVLRRTQRVMKSEG